MFISEQMPPGMPSAAQARTIQGIPSGASDQEKVSLTLFLQAFPCISHSLNANSMLKISSKVYYSLPSGIALPRNWDTEVRPAGISLKIIVHNTKLPTVSG